MTAQPPGRDGARSNRSTRPVAVVTGASSGIGAALARAVAARGQHVALVARRADRLDELAAQIERGGGHASAHACDVGDRVDVQRTAEDIARRHGRVDLLVNAAGQAVHALFVDHTLDDVERMMRVNYLGSVYWIKAVLGPMRSAGSGSILNVSSFAGQLAQPDESAYCASKFAVSGLSEAIHHELAPLGILVTCVHPVLVRTEMFTDDVLERMPARTRDSFIDADSFAREALRALDRREVLATIPRRYGFVPRLKALFPRTLGRKIAQVKLAGLSDAPGAGPAATTTAREDGGP